MRISDWSSDVCSSDLDGPGGNAAAGQRIQSLPVDHQVSVVLDDVGRLEITDIAGVIHRVDQEPAAGLERFRGDREHPPAVRVIVRSEKRRVGQEGVSTCRYWWSPYH